MNKTQKKKMFVMRETVIDLTPHLGSQVQGGLCIGISTEGFDLRNYTKCDQTSYTTK